MIESGVADDSYRADGTVSSNFGDSLVQDFQVAAIQWLSDASVRYVRYPQLGLVQVENVHERANSVRRGSLDAEQLHG